MASNLVHSALATHTQVFPVLTAAQINRIRPFASLRHVALGEGFGRTGNPKLHPLRDLEVAQFVASRRVRLGVRSPWF
jgi:hypothetical protein